MTFLLFFHKFYLAILLSFIKLYNLKISVSLTRRIKKNSEILRNKKNKSLHYKRWSFQEDFCTLFAIHRVWNCLLFISTGFFWNVTYNSEKTFPKLLHNLLGALDGTNLSHTILPERKQKVRILSSVMSHLIMFVFFRSIATVCF